MNKGYFEYRFVGITITIVTFSVIQKLDENVCKFKHFNVIDLHRTQFNRIEDRTCYYYCEHA